MENHSEFSISVIRNLSDLAAHVPQLEELAEHVATPNVFYEPWMLLPLLCRTGRSNEYEFVLMFRRRSDGTAMLCGFFPFERDKVQNWLPIRSLRPPREAFVYRGTPLLRDGFEDACFRALFRWLLQRPGRLSLLDINRVPGGTRVQRALERQLSAEPRLRFDAISRHSYRFRKAAHSESFLAALCSARKLKDLRRRRKRLDALGDVQLDHVKADSDIDALTNEFLALEAASWKGRAGTALASDAGRREYFKEVMRAAFARGRLWVIGLRLDGRLIAASVSFAAQSGLFTFKVAHDEALARCSPGVCLLIEELEMLYRSRFPTSVEPTWIDTCTSPNSVLLQDIKGEPFPIYRYRVAPRTSMGGIVVALLPLLRAIRNAGASARRKVRRAFPNRSLSIPRVVASVKTNTVASSQFTAV